MDQAAKEVAKSTIMDFLRGQAELARKSNVAFDEEGLLDAKADTAYTQLTRIELSNTEEALGKMLDKHAGGRRLAAILSFAIKYAAEES